MKPLNLILSLVLGLPRYVAFVKSLAEFAKRKFNLTTAIVGVSCDIIMLTVYWGGFKVKIISKLLAVLQKN